MTATQAPTPGPLSGDNVKLLVKLLDTLKPFAEVAEKLKHCHVVEICEPTPENPSRNIIPMPREWFERAGDDLEYIAIQLHASGVLSEGQASKITGLDRVSVRREVDRLAPTAPVEASGSEREDEDAIEVEDMEWPESPLANDLYQHLQSQFCLHPDEAAEETGEVLSILAKHGVDPTKLPLNLRPQPSGETRELLGHSVNLGFKTDEPTLRQMIEHYYRSHSMPDPMKWADRYVAALLSACPLALGGQQGEEEEVQYEVWGAGPQGDFCAGSDTLSDAQHYAAVYGQDGPVVIKVATTTRVDWSEASSALSTTPARAEAQDEDTPCTDCGDTGVTHQTERRCSCQEAEAQDEGAAGYKAALIDDLRRYYNDCTPSQMHYAQSDGLAFALDTAIRLLSDAHPSPTPAADADRVRIAVEALEEIAHLIKISPDVPSDDFDRGARAARFQAFDIANPALAALKSTAAKEGGAA